jgi:hypothetical protein
MTTPETKLNPGDTMKDGTIFAGISPDVNEPMYTTPADAPLCMTFNMAKEYASQLDTYGHKDWRVPTKNELNALFNERAAIGGFNVSGSYPAGLYWSSSQIFKWFGWYQRFRGAWSRDFNPKGYHSSVRCVRG